MSVDKPKELVNRVAEWSTLEKVWKSSRPELVFVIGRRRVGKSVLLSSFCEAVGGVYFQATGSNCEWRPRMGEAYGTTWKIRWLIASTTSVVRGNGIGGKLSTAFDSEAEVIKEIPTTRVLDGAWLTRLESASHHFCISAPHRANTTMLHSRSVEEDMSMASS